MALRGRLAGSCIAVVLGWTPAATATEAECRDGDGSLKSGCYLDRDGRPRVAADEYLQRLEERDPMHLRTLGEEVLILGLGTIWYWADRERNLADWDFPSWKERFTLEAWRFDNNHFPINYLGHSLNGGAFYALPRANDQSVLAATAYGFATSFAWEFLIEYREKVSVNDLLVTTGAGLPIGELAHKLWRYFGELPPDPTLLQRVAAATLGFPRWAHREADDAPPAEGPYDEHGYATAVRPRLSAGYRVRLHRFGGEALTTHGGFLRARVSTLPGEGRPGRFSLFFHEADVVRFWLDAGAGARGRELEMLAETHLLGLYGQDVDARGAGYGGILGLTLGYRYRFRDLEGYNDRLAMLHMPGLGADFTYGSGPIRLETRYRLHADFSGIHSDAYPRWAAQLPEGARPKTILRKHGYYYGFGVSSRASARLHLGPVDLGAGFWLGTYDSVEGLDRAQEELSHDPDSDDSLAEGMASLGFTVPGTSMRIGVGWRRSDRVSRVEAIEATRALESWFLSTQLNL